jgi:allantoin racemase
MRLAILNPNTTAAMTQAVVREVRSLVPAGAEVFGLTARSGPAVIDSPESFALGAKAALDTWTSAQVQCDALLLACFGDPGLSELRKTAGVPVIGLAEAAILESFDSGHHFGIVTAGPMWRPMLDELVATLGATERYCGTFALPINGKALAQAPHEYAAAIQDAAAAARRSGASDLILGGAAFSAFVVPAHDGLTIVRPVQSAVSRLQRTVLR